METAHTSLIHSLFFSTGGETNVYAIVAPFVVGLILLEIVAAAYLRKRTGKRLISFQEAMMKFGTQLCNQSTNVLLAVGWWRFMAGCGRITACLTLR